ncbi:AfsR/SARP family transcriptional regulator [Kribbella deserti]|uniref:BTAD domain-containing putative transcriptional regulator n=1 Tax=Kribbella deserti TaxID=1926257 RepID=A0ABV6QN03_9ACTN
MTDQLMVRVLGPIDVVNGGAIHPVAGVRRSAVLAILALQPGQVVSAERLIDLVWADDAPATALNTLQSTVSFLRRTLGLRDTLLARSSGYVLSVGGEGVDAVLAERLIRESRHLEDPAQIVKQLGSALAMWRGEPLGGLAGQSWFDDHVGRLQMLRRSALQSLTDARLALGEHALLVGDLEQACGREPLNEELHAQLMLALYRCGRQAEALAAFHRLRRRLADDLGLSPALSVQDLHTAILRQDRALDLSVGEPVEVSVTRPIVPAQLPAVTGSFVAREQELQQLDQYLDGRATGTVVQAISGPAGVGKTTLALHWAHWVAARFPDGQLFANLHGYDRQGRGRDPYDVMAGFLEALGIPPARIPAERDTRAGLYRSVMAGKEILIVLDNAHDAEQVLPLLPGAAEGMVMVTSRDRLIPVMVAVDARSLVLEPLNEQDSRALLSARLGEARLTADPRAGETMVSLCGGLPLALAIVAARAATENRSSLTALAHELVERPSLLDALTVGDRRTDVRSVLSWSYQSLDRSSGDLFRRLGAHPAGDFSARTAASANGKPLSQTEEALSELTRRHLILQDLKGRYRFHDLVRSYAMELLDQRAEDRARTIRRVIDHYLRSAFEATLLHTPQRHPIIVVESAEGVSPYHPASLGEALSWFSAERTALVSCVELALQHGFLEHCWQLAWCTTTFLDWVGAWRELAIVHRMAFKAAETLGDEAARAHAVRGLAFACRANGQYDEAAHHLDDAIEVFARLGDLKNEARLHLNYANLHDRRSDPSAALEEALEGLRLYRRADDVVGEAHALNAVGWSRLRLGDPELALQHCEAALRILRQDGHPDGQAVTLDSIGYIHHLAGAAPRAITYFRQAIEMHRALGDRFNQADSLDHLGDAHWEVGDAAAATEAWVAALAILDELKHPAAERIRAKL